MNAGELRYDSPTPFTRKQRFLLWLVPPLIALLLKLTFLWCRSFEVRDRDRLMRQIAAKKPYVLAFWHESMALALWPHRGMDGHTLTSYSFDGEMAARVVSWFGFHAVRGSSSKGGANAVDQLQKAMVQCPMIGFTLDGPRGPRRVAKPGVAIVAGRSGAVILPLAFAVSAAWRLKSWDRLPIPKPFARVLCAYGDPIVLSDEDDREAMTKAAHTVEEALNALYRKLELELGQTSIPE